jgi:hypothetical protein
MEKARKNKAWDQHIQNTCIQLSNQATNKKICFTWWHKQILYEHEYLENNGIKLTLYFFFFRQKLHLHIQVGMAWHISFIYPF